MADLHHSGCSLDAGVLDRLCAGGRLAVPLRAGHRVGEEVRQRAQPRHNSASADRSCPAERLSSTHYYLLLLLDHPRLDLETWSLAKIRVPERFGGWSNVGLGLGEVVAATDETFGGGGGGGN